MNIYPIRWDGERAYYALRPPCPRGSAFIFTARLPRSDALALGPSSRLHPTTTTTATTLLLLWIFTAVTVCVLCCGAPLQPTAVTSPPHIQYSNAPGPARRSQADRGIWELWIPGIDGFRSFAASVFFLTQHMLSSVPLVFIYSDYPGLISICIYWLIVVDR